jgi:hypothetical protein
MSDGSQDRNDGLWGSETRLPTLVPQDTDVRPPPATAITAKRRAQLAIECQLREQQARAAAARREREHADDREVDGGEHEPLATRMQWEHTSRDEAGLSIDPWLNDVELLDRLDALPNGYRRVIDLTDGDRVVSVVDLDGDDHIDGYEMTAAMVTDWGDVADSIDERIAERPNWPALNAALVTATRNGYDVTGNLPRLAAEAPLPTWDPACELYYRPLNSGGVDPDTYNITRVSGEPPRRAEPPSRQTDTPHTSAPAV